MSLNAKITLLMCDVLEYYYRRDLEREKAAEEKRKRSRKRKFWQRSWITRREQFDGASSTLLRGLAVEDPKSYKNCLSEENFNALLSMLDPKLQREDTIMRGALPLSLKLEITLRYLATGDSFQSLSYLFRVPSGSISGFLPEVLNELKNKLLQFSKIPNKKEDWFQIGQKFMRRWNFPRCGGALDGKRIRIQCPEFYNYKRFSSIVLFALVDADYKFTYVSIEADRRAGDAGIWHVCALKTGLEDDSLNFPSDYTIVGDDIFPLKNYLMKPYSGRKLTKKKQIFNYRLSRARRTVVNAFGVLAWRFRIFQRPINTKVETAELIVWVACLLHNWLCEVNPTSVTSLADIEDPESGAVTPGTWREVPQPLKSASSLGSNDYAKNADTTRDSLANYFLNEGAIPWQWKKACVSEYSDGDSCMDDDSDYKGSRYAECYSKNPNL